MKTNKISIIAGTLLFILIFFSCKDYLDVVPDNVPIVDHAFSNRHQAEGFLYGCYSFLPAHANPENNPAFLAGDEAWIFNEIEFFDPQMWEIAKGEQGTNSPLANYWAAEMDNFELNGGKPLFTAIRDCNIFLENIHKPKDLYAREKENWIAEVKCLKAYYHFWLMRLYGPIPIMDTNLPISSGPDEVQKYREPVDEVVEYIVGLLDEAAANLPLKVENETDDLGRFTRPAVLALKGQVLTYAASPLFNGNSDYAGVTDDRGVELFNQTYDLEKWEKAADALKTAIDVSHEAGYELYDFSAENNIDNLSEQTILAMQVRGAVTDKWNSEIIWGEPRGTERIQQFSFPAFFFGSFGSAPGANLLSYAPPMRIVEQFYTENGVPIEEDKAWVDIDPYSLREGNKDHKYYIKEGFETLNLHFNREPRFYGSISFDGGTFFGNGDFDDTDLLTTRFKYMVYGEFAPGKYSSTGYLVKKVISWRTSQVITGSSYTTFSPYRYSFPVIRLADLYLMYAEALNEYKVSPDAEVYEYIDLVRNRTGLDGVLESWADHSLDPNKPMTKEGMRDIIHRERMNELAFEGMRFWDLRRWKLSEEYMNEPIRGLSIYEPDNDFFQVKEIYSPAYEKKDYLWPISQSNLLRNKNLIQNPGW